MPALHIAMSSGCDFGRCTNFSMLRLSKIESGCSIASCFEVAVGTLQLALASGCFSDPLGTSAWRFDGKPLDVVSILVGGELLCKRATF